MLLYTDSDLRIKASKIITTGTGRTSEKYPPVPFSINNTPLTAFYVETSNTYRFKWGDHYFKLFVDEVKALPIHEQMKFYTDKKVEEALQKLFPGKEKKIKSTSFLKGGPFVTMIQHPGIKGVFVGTVLRVMSFKDDGVVVYTTDGIHTIPPEFYRYSSNGEVYSYFIRQGSGYAKIILEENILPKIVSLKGVAEDLGVVYYEGGEAPLECCFVVTPSEILTHLKEEVKKDYQMDIGSTVVHNLGTKGKVTNFLLDTHNAFLLVQIESTPGSKPLVRPVKEFKTLNDYSSLRGNQLLEYYKKQIEELLIVDKNPKSVVWETFFTQLKTYAKEKLK
jgi:hypothetical protein